MFEEVKHMLICRIANEIKEGSRRKKVKDMHSE